MFVNSFVQVRLVHVEEMNLALRTTLANEGINPEWNESMKIPYRSKEETFDPKNLEHNRGILYFQIFDQIEKFESNTELQTGSFSKEKKFLGSFKIPLVNLFMNPKQEAMLRIHKPLALFGYLNLIDPDKLYEHNP